MSTSGSYDPHAIEPKIYEFWERRGHFHAEPDPNRRPYSIVIPPPNVTGALHLGHALNGTLQDMLVRHARMRGLNTCWLPGTDHAGIATQAVVEKRVRTEEGKSRHELGREGLVQKIWEWKNEYNERILNQFRRLGASCDWKRTRFTLDDGCVKAVYEQFFRWFRDGLIYRGQRLVNWDCELQTAVADDEVYHETVKGSLWHIRYPILAADAAGNAEDLSGDAVREAIERATQDDAREGHDFLVVATTRPETMLGDVAVAVHPHDERYRHLIGRHCLLPLMHRPIPIIGDGELVDPKFGTGCVKVTPGHDPNDYECGRRNELPMISVLAPDGRINENGKGSHGATTARSREGAGSGPAGGVHDYSGMSRQDARKQVVKDLDTLGLLAKTEPYETEIGHSDRSKSPIEPLLSEQWFVRMDSLAEMAMEAVRDGRVQFFPERFAKSYLDWLGEKRDWCISRQLWWGHRIPVWTLSNVAVSRLSEDPAQLASLTEALQSFEESGKVSHQVITQPGAILDAASAPEVARIQSYFCPSPDSLDEFSEFAEEHGLEQDPDVLDTWFSSALWPISTWGWPIEGREVKGRGDATPDDEARAIRAAAADLDYFYPTNVLSTARDIISLWVARMVIAGLYNLGRVPFQHVCIHPTIQDGQGRRMSKSIGNGVDPLDLIQLYGADATRFTLASMAGETQDVRVPVVYLCPHCGETFAQKQEHLGKATVKCAACKREIATRLADQKQIDALGLAPVTSDRFELGRNFCNKLWQAATGFVLRNLEGYAPHTVELEQLTLEDHWILSRLSACIAEVDRKLREYQYSDVTGTLYAFFWNDFCDWYIELAKPRLSGDEVSAPGAAGGGDVARQVLAWVLDQTLRLLHPVTPFITEALWHKLNEAAPRRGIFELETSGPALIVARWPDTTTWPRERAIEREMGALQEVIRALREVRARINVLRAEAKESALRTLPRAVVKADRDMSEHLRRRTGVLCRLGQCDALEIGPEAAKPGDAFSSILSGIEVYVPVGGLADLQLEAKRLRKQQEELAGHIERVQGKLSNEKFVRNAPDEVVDRERERLAELKQRAATVEQNLAELGG